MAAAPVPVPTAGARLLAQGQPADALWTPGFREWPPAVASALFLAWIAWFIRADLHANGGHLIYMLDDTYAHMAIAKYLVRNGVWGFCAREGFSSGGSSLLWPLLLAGWYAVAGVNEYAPLALNLIAAVGTLFYAAGMIRRYTRSGVINLLILLALVSLTPLPNLMLMGMEHTWQILIDLIFIDLSSRVLADEEPPTSIARARRWLPPMAILLTGIRYEGLFVLGLVGLLLLCRRQWSLAVRIGIAGGLPITIFGLYSMARGWFFLPNSLLLKSSVPPVGTWSEIGRILARVYDVVTDNAYLGALILAMAAALVALVSRHRTIWSRPAVWQVVMLGVLAQHLELVGIGWFHRYEMYLIALGIISVVLAVLDGIPPADATRQRAGRSAYLVAAAGAGMVFGTPLVLRAMDTSRLIVAATHNVYEQQFLMAWFLHDFYQDKGVAANDIGAIDYFADIELVDTWGLGSMEVARAKRAGVYDEEVVRRLCSVHNVRVIAGYDEWMVEYGGPLAEWVPVGQWTIPNNVVCGGSTLSFYAPRAELAPALIAALRQFSPRLPRDVIQAGAYVGGPPPHVLGTYPMERNQAGEPFYWTRRHATFYLAPLDCRPSPPGDAATLIVPYTPVRKITGLTVVLNGETVASRDISAEEIDHPTAWPIKVRWRHGSNELCIVGRGAATWPDNGDSRRLLFAIGEPQWIFNSLPAVPAAP